jgi:CheY-like chemotaxis protein
VRAMLEPRGFRTFEAGDGEEALRIVERESIHVVLLDYNMPRLSGIETLKRVKQIRELLPCILVSAEMDDRLRKEAEAAQVFSVLTKPVSRLEITNSVDAALRATYGE